MFDEEPDGDPHGECAAEIQRLAAQVEALTTENANILRASLYSADIATQAMEEVKTLTADREALENAPNAWADLWYFVMDEEPMAFEKIVTECTPAIWHSEAHKLMRAKYPK